MTQEERLVDIYTSSRARLLKDIDERLLTGRSTYYQKDLLKEIEKELGRLNVDTAAWAQDAVQESYTQGAKGAWNAVRAAEPGVAAFGSFGGLHKRAINILSQNTQDYLNITNNLIARHSADVLREIGLSMTVRKFTEGLTQGEMRKGLMSALEEAGFASVPMRDGRGFLRVDSYAKMVARTTIAEATNTGTINQMDALEHYTVKMTGHNTTCKVCASRQNRVYRTAPEDAFPKDDPRRGLPHISEGMPRWPEYKTIHPNCRHRLAPYIWEQKDEDELKETIKDAKKPFDVDTRGEAERLRYERSQQVNASRLSDRKQWEKYKTALGPDKVPKSFSGFRAMKRANSEAYRTLRADYRNRPKLVSSA